mmetsp:Transcript_37173/g.94278  ORF Transcript_37173/g.94278 Transcript_37173/m.94278 type:complete len:225 (+) Transcript_37173:231-905(+)
MRIMEVPLPRRRRVAGAARPKHISFACGGPCRRDEAGQADDLLLCERLHSPVTHQRRVSHELNARRVAEEPADFCVVGRLGILHAADHRTEARLLPVAPLGVHMAKEVRARRRPLKGHEQGAGAAPAPEHRHAVEHAKGRDVGKEDVYAGRELVVPEGLSRGPRGLPARSEFGAPCFKHTVMIRDRPTARHHHLIYVRWAALPRAPSRREQLEPQLGVLPDRDV